MSLSRGRGPCREDDWCLITLFVLGARADIVLYHEHLVSAGSVSGPLGSRWFLGLLACVSLGGRDSDSGSGWHAGRLS